MPRSPENYQTYASTCAIAELFGGIRAQKLSVSQCPLPFFVGGSINYLR